MNVSAVGSDSSMVVEAVTMSHREWHCNAAKEGEGARATASTVAAKEGGNVSASDDAAARRLADR